MLGRNRPHRLAAAASRAGPRCPAARLPKPAEPWVNSRPGPLLLEHAAGRAAARRVREQRGGQVVPGALRDDRVDPVVVGGGQQREPAAVGRAGDAHPRIARMVQQHPRLPGQPADQLLDVLDLVVRRVERDLPGGPAEAARRPGRAPRTRPGPATRPPGRTAYLVSPNPCASRIAGTRPWPGGVKKRGVEHHVLVVARPVRHGDPQVPHPDGRRAAGDDEAGHHRGGHQDRGHHRGQDAPAPAPQVHTRTVATRRHCPGPAASRRQHPVGWLGHARTFMHNSGRSA